MKIAIYARESDSDTTKAPPIENQIEIGKKWAEANGHEIHKIYADNGFSGGDWKRPEWAWIVADARARKFKTIWVWSQDRIARDTEQFLWFYRQLYERGCNVISEVEGEINMETAGDRLKHTSMAMMAEMVRTLTGEKVKRTYESRKREADKKGERVVWGRAPIPDKYKTQILEIKAQNPNWGYRKIAKALPSYKNKKGNERTISYGWVRTVIKSPPKIAGEKGVELEGVKNNPIVEQGSV